MQLICCAPDHTSSVIDVADSEIVIGRSMPGGRAIHVNLAGDALVSRAHARLVRQGNEWWLEDLGSRHGTFVNGRRVDEPTRVGVGDTLVLGETTVILGPVQASAGGAGGAGGSPAGAIPETEDESSGFVDVTITAGEAAGQLVGGGRRAAARLGVAQRRLTALYELSTALATVDSVYALADTFIHHVCLVLAGARAGLLLLEDGRLLLKAHFPPGEPAFSRTLAARALESRDALIWRAREAGGDTAPTTSLVRYRIQEAMYVPLVWRSEALGVAYVGVVGNDRTLEEEDLRLVLALANQASVFVKGLAFQQAIRQEEALRKNLLRQFSPKVADRMQRQGGRLHLGGQRVERASVLVSDVRGFTAHSQGLDPDDIVEMLNELFSTLVPIIFRHDGTVDKFVGDAVLAVFGTPEADEKHAEHAVRAALDMQAAMLKLHASWAQRDLPQWQIGIGIHTGPLIHGFIGARDRMEFTVIGDTVNRASRYCDGAQGGEVVISRELHAYVFDLVRVAPTVVRGKHAEAEGALHGYVLQGLADPP